MATKEHRRVNSTIKKINKSLSNDDFLGKGRFCIKQLGMYGRPEWEVFYVISFVDNKTGKTLEKRITNYDYRRILFWDLNEFIIEVRKKEGW